MSSESSKHLPMRIAQLTKTNRQLKTRIDTITKSNQQLDKLVTKYKQDISNLQNKISTLETEKRSLKYQVKKLTQQLETTDNSLTQSQLKNHFLTNEIMDYDCIYNIIPKCNDMLQKDIGRISFQLKNMFVFYMQLFEFWEWSQII